MMRFGPHVSCRNGLALWIAVCLLSPIFAGAQAPPQAQLEQELAGPYATQQANPVTSRRGDLCRRLEPILRKQGRFMIGQLHPWSEDPEALLLTDGNHGEHGLRPNTQTAYGLAVLARCVPGDDAAGPSPETARQKALAILRFVLPTHGAGGRLCTDGKPWTSQWQSAHWAAQAGRAAWLLWDDLTPEQRWLAARMVCDEADRFIDREPDHNVQNDTKAEENAWNAQVIALAACMFPNHPRHDAWRESAIRWQLSAYAVSADTVSTQTIEGRPLSEWVRFPNLHDDYTLENHSRVHPDYMTAFTLNVNQSEMYEWAGLRRPVSVLFNVDKIYANLKLLSLPDGGFVYPSGQDWQLHRNPDWVYCHTAMSVLLNDAQAATLARLALATAERMIDRDPQGGMYAPGETNFPSSQSGIMDSYSSAWLLLARAGEGPAPVSGTQLWRDLAGRHLFPYGQFGVVRTAHSVATFSWGRQVMGQVYPLRPDLLTTPYERGLIGMVQTEGVKNEAPKVIEARTIETLPGALAVAGVLDRGDGALEQRFAFLALPDGRVVYADSVRPSGQGAATTVTLGTLGVLNDRQWVWHDGQRRLTFADGEQVFTAATAAGDAPVRLASPWYNLDGLGIAVLSSAGACYDPRPTRAAGRLEQLFSLNAPATPDALQPTVLVFHPGQEPERTRAVVERTSLDVVGPSLFELTLEDETHVTIDLAASEIQVR